MIYRVYFSAQPLAGEPTDNALKTTVSRDFKTEAEALAKCREFLDGGVMLPVALDHPEGNRLCAGEIKLRCFSQ